MTIHHVDIKAAAAMIADYASDTGVTGVVDELGPMATFLWAAGGSFALEVISLYNEIKAERAVGLPKYYKSPVFWIVRLLVTGIAGALAVAEDAGTPLIAVNIGASAPAILQLLTKPAQL